MATTLSYNGDPISGPVTVEIDPDIGATKTFTFTEVLNPETEISIDARESSEPELGARTKIRINGVEEVIHTSCSTDFVAGETAPLDDPKDYPSPNWFVEDFVQKP